MWRRIRRTPEDLLYTQYGTPLGPGDDEALAFLTALPLSI